MDKLIALEEVQAMAALFSKCPMTPAEMLWANMFANRLFVYAQPKPPEKDASLDVSETVDHDIKQPGPDAT